MLARTCLLAGEKTNNMSSVIRLLDQTYQRLLCDENNTDKNSNVKHSNDDSNNQPQSIKEQSQDVSKNGENTKMTIDVSSPQTPLNANNAISMNGTETSTTTASTLTSNLQNELSSTSSSALSASSQISNEIKHVSNKKAEITFIFKFKPLFLYRVSIKPNIKL